MKSKNPVPLSRPLPVSSSKSNSNKKPIAAAFPFINSFFPVNLNGNSKTTLKNTGTLSTSSTFTSEAVTPGLAFPLKTISVDLSDCKLLLMLMYIFSLSVFTGYTNKVLRGGVSALSTRFLGYQSLISPVRKSKVLSVVGQTIHPSCNKSKHANTVSPSCMITRRSPFGRAARGTTGTQLFPLSAAAGAE
ncbi:ATPase E1-E2 type family protein / haloaciddehalogenase-like hydrolase family protein [Striga asiatica]|uniref:ATPase E1-E2 type family protein / haloaciddehalogenase-like hydrolase family protein n=1 Tax=Striga asiatica TaxID=4170 RepID=A0A5A7P4M7_STRAF|nr:ATPase E1-E2 type family protein / haloaciddehalogenase-like hydrolase family protein [Striga asiatica]